MRPRFRSLIDPNFDELFRALTTELVPVEARRAPTVAMDIFEHDDRFECWLDVPGVAREDIKLSLEGDALTIQGERPAQAVTEERHYRRTERWTGSFSRTITLPNTVDATRIGAKLEEGVLRVVLPKRDQAKPRQIPISG